MSQLGFPKATVIGTAKEMPADSKLHCKGVIRSKPCRINSSTNKCLSDSLAQLSNKERTAMEPVHMMSPEILSHLTQNIGWTHSTNKEMPLRNSTFAWE
jgi:hypothetical protein